LGIIVIKISCCDFQCGITKQVPLFAIIYK
jgi:hypothetical protein